MGSADSQPNERPVHRVRLTKPYYIGKHEITQAEFRRFVDATDYVTTAERSGGAKVWSNGTWRVDETASWKSVFVGARRPVVAVTWNDAMAFCQWLTQLERQTGTLKANEAYRLPTEAQWEWAARAGTDLAYFGTADRAQVCKYGNVPDRSADDAGFGRSFLPCTDNVGIGTAEVGSFSPNGWDLHDMMGNVPRVGPRRLRALPPRHAAGPPWVARTPTRRSCAAGHGAASSRGFASRTAMATAPTAAAAPSGSVSSSRRSASRRDQWPQPHSTGQRTFPSSWDCGRQIRGGAVGASGRDWGAGAAAAR